MKYYIMHLPLDKDSAIVYLAHLGCIYGDGYTWTGDKNLAQQYSLSDALDIKKNFSAFKDSRENLVIACADRIKGRWDDDEEVK